MLMLAAALVSAASPAAAKPKRRDAKLAFDRGVAAYKSNRFVAASAALAKSFELERDVDTLFAWAQSERKLDHCDKAIELYEKLLAFDLPEANREAVDVKLAECRSVAAESPPRVAARVEPRRVEPARVEPVRAEPARVEPRAEPARAEPRVEPRAEPARAEPRTDPNVAAPASPSPVAEAQVVAPPPDGERSARHAWYTDPVTLTLLGLGVTATGVGTGFLVSARALDSDSKAAFLSNHYDDAQHLADQAKSRGNIGVVTIAAGGALLAGGVVWMALHRGGSEQRVVTGWLVPTGGGLAVTGGF